MAIQSGFFDGQLYYADSFNKAFAGLISNGVVGTKATNLQVVENTGMIISVHSGYAWIEGCHLYNTSDYNLTVDTADGTLDRIDRVIARKNLIDNTCELLIIKGDLSDNPIAPDLVRDGTYYDLGLATIYISAGTTEITQDMITDTRFDSDVCGQVYCLAKDIDTTDLFAQYQAEWDNFISQLGNDEHIEIEVTSNANKINSIPVDLTNITDGQVPVYDATNNKIIAGTGGLTEKDVFMVCAEGITKPPALRGAFMQKAYIPSSVTSLPAQFLQQTNVQEVIFDENCGEIIADNNLCYMATSLKSFNASTITEVGYSVFKQCTSLEDVYLPALTQAGYSFLEGCTSLEDVYLPALTQAGSNFLNGCTSLKNISFGGRSNFLSTVPYLQSEYLTDESFLEVANALIDRSDATAITIYVNSSRWATVPQTTKDIFNSKNYTVSAS